MEEAIKLVTEGGRQLTDVARSLGIHEKLLDTWNGSVENSQAVAYPLRL